MPIEYNEYLHKIPTPIDTINQVGGGGFRQGMLCEAWGPPGGGKTTFCYQTAGLFQFMYGVDNCFVHVLDAENSVDILRLEKVFKIDTSKNFLAEPAPTIETVYAAITKQLIRCEKEKLFYLGIIDSWTVLSTDADLKSSDESVMKGQDLSMFAGGRMLKARAGRHYLNLLMGKMYQKPFTVILINQASTEIGKWQTSITSSGGYGLKHNIQFSLYFERGKEEVNDGGAISGVSTKVSLTKSKFTPQVNDIPCVINTLAGGIFNTISEIIEMGLKKGVIAQTSGWYRIPGEEGQKSLRWTDIAQSPELLKKIRQKLIETYKDEFSLVKMHYDKAESFTSSTDSRG